MCFGPSWLHPLADPRASTEFGMPLGIPAPRPDLASYPASSRGDMGIAWHALLLWQNMFDTSLSSTFTFSQNGPLLNKRRGNKTSKLIRDRAPTPRCTGVALSYMWVEYSNDKITPELDSKPCAWQFGCSGNRLPQPALPNHHRGRLSCD